MSILTVTISPEVICTVVRNTALATPGHALSQQLRQSVAAVVEEITGIPGGVVDVSIEDVRK